MKQTQETKKVCPCGHDVFLRKESGEMLVTIYEEKDGNTRDEEAGSDWHSTEYEYSCEKCLQEVDF